MPEFRDTYEEQYGAPKRREHAERRGQTSSDSMLEQMVGYPAWKKYVSDWMQDRKEKAQVDLNRWARVGLIRRYVAAGKMATAALQIQLVEEFEDHIKRSIEQLQPKKDEAARIAKIYQKK